MTYLIHIHRPHHFALLCCNREGLHCIFPARVSEVNGLRVSRTGAGSKMFVWDLLAGEERGSPRFRGVSKVWNEEFGTLGQC